MTTHAPPPAPSDSPGAFSPTAIRAMSLRVGKTPPPRFMFVGATRTPVLVVRDAVNAPGNAVVAAVYPVDGIDPAAIAAEIAMLPELLRLRDAVLGNQFGDSLLELARNAQPSAV